MRELFIQIPKEEHSREKGKPVQRIEGKSIPESSSGIKEVNIPGKK